MNLFVDAHLFDGPGQGTKTYLKGLYKPLLSEHTEATFYMAASHPEKLRKEFEPSQNLKCIEYSWSNKYLRLSTDIPRLIKQNKIDKAHFQYISPLRKTCSEIVTIHDLLFLDYPNYFPSNYKLTKNFLFKRSAKRADLITTVSEYSKEQLVRHYKIEPERIAVTPNGVLDLYWNGSKSGSNIKSKYGADQFMLYVSRFEPRKNQTGLLKAYIALELWKENIQLVLIGSKGISDMKFEQLYASLDSKVKSKILILRDIDFQDLKQFYQNCLLFVYPSFAEGFGIPPLEASASGATVICSNKTSMSDFDFYGEQLFDPNNQSDLQEKILYYINHPLRPDEKMIIQKEIYERYNWDASARIFWNRINAD